MEWLSVDTKPEHGQKVLCYSPEDTYYQEDYRIVRYGTVSKGFPPAVTHWTPLSPPK